MRIPPLFPEWDDLVIRADHDRERARDTPRRGLTDTPRALTPGSRVYTRRNVP